MIYNYQGILPTKLNNCNFGLWILNSKANLTKAPPLKLHDFFYHKRSNKDGLLGVYSCWIVG